MKKFVNIKNARSGEYKRIIEKIAARGICPFCEKHFKDREKKRHAFKEKNGWFLTENNWPYKNTNRHFIIISEKHKENFSELTKNDLQSVAYLVSWSIKKYKIKGGALTLRFGDTSFTGASVGHLHFHIISPKINKKTKRGKTVNFPVG